MKIKIIPIIIVLSSLSIFFIFYKGLKSSNIYIPNSNFEKKIPFFTAVKFDTNDEIKSDQIFKTNEYYLVNIWSSWCVPCRYEHPFLMDLSEQKNLKIIGLNYKDKIDNAKKFLDDLNNPFEIILMDKNGTIAIEWGAYGVPESFLIYEKRIIKKIIGPLDKESIFEIKELIK